MGTKLLFLCVIYQTLITTSFGGVTVPYTDLIGKVTPIKPKPLSPSTVSSSISTQATISPLTWNAEEIIPKLSSPSAGGTVSQEFSLPLAYTCSSRALPVPKIDSLSIQDVKIPDRLREKFLLRKLNTTPSRHAKPDISTELPLSYKNPFGPSPINLPTSSSFNPSLEYFTSLNKLPVLPNIKSLPTVPLKSYNRNSLDLSGSAFQTGNFVAPSTINSRSTNSDATLETRKPSFSEPLCRNTLFQLSSSNSLAYPLHYKSMYLPRVRTPSQMPLKFRYTSNTESQSFNVPTTCNKQNVFNSLPERKILSAIPLLSPTTTSEISKPLNMIQVPQKSSNVPISTTPMHFATNPIKHHWSPLETNCGSDSVLHNSKFDSLETLKSSLNIGCDKNVNPLPYIKTGIISTCKPKPLVLPKTSSISASIPLPNSMNDIGIENHCFINKPAVCSIGTYEQTADRIYTNSLMINQQSNDYNIVPSLKRVHVPCPAINSCHYPSLLDDCVSGSFKHSPPTIPTELLPTISSGTAFSTIPYPSSPIQSPVTYITKSSSSPITQTTSKIVSSINGLVSNIAKNILSSYKSYLNSASQNVLPSNPYDCPISNPIHTVPVMPIPLENPEPLLPVINLPTHSISLPAVDTSSILSLDVPCMSPIFEIPSSQSSPIFSSQPIIATLTPINYSSPPICPSYLPSPILPSYATISSPFYMEPPIYKVSSSKKDSEADKLIELMLLAEILNNDESFDWDDLDTLLALLSVS